MLTEEVVARMAKARQVERKGNQPGATLENSPKLEPPIDTRAEAAKAASGQQGLENSPNPVAAEPIDTLPPAEREIVGEFANDYAKTGVRTHRVGSHARRTRRTLRTESAAAPQRARGRDRLADRSGPS